MSRQVAGVLYVAAMVATVVAVDFLFFRHHLWERLTVNIGIVFVFAAFYFRFFKVRQHFYAISAERKLQHPAVVAISNAAKQELFR